ncbi:hypothetical protein K4F52_006484 [Lecanicillium sp. MT-2017a]|nr:hypothetical protein K4F52_006484 [Lecanicillium sp. MT-2017a]
MACANQAEYLNDLRSKRDLKLIDTIDELRSQGVSQFISLPQLIVCGDQSSGKSSVLEAISGVPFPSKSNLCTRFPTEVILRKDAVAQTIVSIVPHPDSTAQEKERLAKLRTTLTDFQRLPQLIEGAHDVLGLNGSSSAFSKHALRVEVCGPKLPHLTIVDLPGLIHSANRQQTTADVTVIRGVVSRYMQEPRSIILAVISAKNDYANQIVLNMAREFDENGSRTLGVITKPDTLHPRSESERTYLNLVRNKEIHLGHGWHVVKNLDSDQGIAGLAERHAKEEEFFATGSWATLHDSCKGIDSLRKRLSGVLFQQISAELPKLLDEISTRKRICEMELAKLGEPRENVNQQRRYLAHCAATFQSLLSDALHGNYDDQFFESVDTSNAYNKRIRAIVQNLLTEFAEYIKEHGRLHRVVSRSSLSKGRGSEILMTEDDFIKNISNRMRESRGRELPGMFNPSVISDLFREESRLWENITMNAIKGLWHDVKDAMQHLAYHCADKSTAKSIFERIVVPEMTGCLQKMDAEIQKNLKSHRSVHAITYDRYYTETLKKIRMERYTRQITTIIKQDVSDDKVNEDTLIPKLVRILATCQDNADSEFTAVEALDMLNAYYKVVIKRFIDQTAAEVVEICFLQALPGIFSPTVVASMEEKLISRLASETQECIATRQELNQQIAIFAQESDSEEEEEDADDGSEAIAVNSQVHYVSDDDENGEESSLFVPPPANTSRSQRKRRRGTTLRDERMRGKRRTTVKTEE